MWCCQCPPRGETPMLEFSEGAYGARNSQLGFKIALVSQSLLRQNWYGTVLCSSRMDYAEKDVVLSVEEFLLMGFQENVVGLDRPPLLLVLHDLPRHRLRVLLLLGKEGRWWWWGFVEIEVEECF
ncbi:hypothetical protein Tco_1317265 [Tanacetum coccineum]